MCSISVPKGNWWHLLEERWYEGDQTVRVDAPLESIPVFLRDGAEIPLGFDGEMRHGVGMARRYSSKDRSSVARAREKRSLLA